MPPFWYFSCAQAHDKTMAKWKRFLANQLATDVSSTASTSSATAISATATATATAPDGTGPAAIKASSRTTVVDAAAQGVLDRVAAALVAVVTTAAGAPPPATVPLSAAMWHEACHRALSEAQSTPSAGVMWQPAKLSPPSSSSVYACMSTLAVKLAATVVSMLDPVAMPAPVAVADKAEAQRLKQLKQQRVTSITQGIATHWHAAWTDATITCQVSVHGFLNFTLPRSQANLAGSDPMLVVKSDAAPSSSLSASASASASSASFTVTSATALASAPAASTASPSRPRVFSLTRHPATATEEAYQVQYLFIIILQLSSWDYSFCFCLIVCGCMVICVMIFV
jgi:hypothetical protein